MRLGKALSVLAAIAMVTALATSCKPTEGKSCRQDGSESCVDSKNALVCHKGTWEPMLCRGVNGCHKVGSDAECDQSIAEDAEVCNLEGDVVCGSDQKSMLECKSARWARTASCLGQNGCVLVGKVVKCDNTVAALGDACTHPDDYACSQDKKVELVCKDGRFSVSATCRGPKGCGVVAKQISCDDTKAVLNDACGKDGSYTCDMESKSILVCRGGHYVVDEPCKGKLNCRVLGTKVGCF